MIAFGSAITKREVYARCAEPGIRRVAEPDSQIFDLASIGSIFASYNAVIERAAACPDLEALVLLHQDTEIVNEDFCARVREAFADPQAGLLGCVGAVAARTIAWWEGSVVTANFLHRYHENGGGDLAAFSWDLSQAPPYVRFGEVETLDGFLLVLSPWVVQNLRFDESLGQFHGYDWDFCQQVRAAGRKVLTVNCRAIHHHGLHPFTDPEPWIDAHVHIAAKWEERLAPAWKPAGSWEERLWRAHAARDAARLTDHANALIFTAERHERERALEQLKGSISWKLTRPLRMARRLLGTTPPRDTLRAASAAGETA